MPIIDQIKEMKQQGLPEEKIIQNLKEQGISPREISEAIDQSRVKSAIYGEPPANSTGEMQPSVMQPAPEEMTPAIPPPQQSQEIQTMPQYPPQAFPQNQGQQLTQGTPYPQEEYAYPEAGGYAGYGYPQYEYAQSGLDTETITDVAQQVVDEKLEKINKQIQNLSKFKSATQGRILDIDARLRKIEISIDRLQSSVLGKIGQYGQNISDLKEEMQATQESFSKVLTPLSDNLEKLKQIAGETGKTLTKNKMTKTEKNRGRPRAKIRKSGSRDGFENYLR